MRSSMRGGWWGGWDVAILEQDLNDLQLIKRLISYLLIACIYTGFGRWLCGSKYNNTWQVDRTAGEWLRNIKIDGGTMETSALRNI